MIPRYSHPEVERLWSDEWTYGTWLDIEIAVLDAQRRHGVLDGSIVSDLWTWMRKVTINEGEVTNIKLIEQTTQHDVAAFLTRLRQARGVPDAAYIHYGLTSSDLVDTAQGIRFARLHELLLPALGDLTAEVAHQTQDATPMLGRTHGQPAEPTSMRARAWHWIGLIESPITDLSKYSRRMQVAKLSGPVGTFAHNPPQVEADAAMALGIRPMGPGASQIVPRADLAAWASAAGRFAASCAKIATDLRLLNLTGEASWRQSEGQVGSSAMPQKNNPIRAEQICGLARVAAGYASMLQPLDLWLERDISNSSVERIAVPDLWHVTFRILWQTTLMLRHLHLDFTMIDEELANHPEAWAHRMTLETIPDAESLEEARESAMIGSLHGDTGGHDAAWFMRQYPSVGMGQA